MKIKYDFITFTLSDYILKKSLLLIINLEKVYSKNDYSQTNFSHPLTLTKSALVTLSSLK